MILLRCFIVAFAFFGSVGQGLAQDQAGMRSILGHTLQTNPSLATQRQILNNQVEEVEQAFAFFLPSISAEGGLNGYNVDPDPGRNNDGLEKSLGLTLSQYLYRGGQTDEGIRQQLNLLKASEYEYRQAVQDVFATVIANAARLTFQRDSLSLAQNNERVLRTQLEATEAGFEYGELTRTDLAQAQARLSAARSDIIRAKGDLETAIAQYSELTNRQPPTIIDITPIDDLLVGERDAIVNQVLTQNLEIVSQLYNIEAARRAVNASRAVLRPQIEMTGDLTKTYDPISGLDSTGGATLGVRASLPIFNRGLNRSDIRQSNNSLYAQKATLDQLRFNLRSQAVTAWQNYQTALAELESRRQQVRASEIAREGVDQERQSGTRTVLDVLDANQELQDARNALLAARRDRIIASYDLLALMGQLSPEAFSLEDQTLNHPQLVGDSLSKSFGHLINPLLKVKNAFIETVSGQQSE